MLGEARGARNANQSGGLTSARDYRILRIMQKVRATDFARNFGRWREQAQREPIAITSHDRVSGYFVSPAEFEAYRTYQDQKTRYVRLEDMPESFIQELLATEMDPKHDHLNALLDD